MTCVEWRNRTYQPLGDKTNFQSNLSHSVLHIYNFVINHNYPQVKAKSSWIWLLSLGHLVLFNSTVLLLLKEKIVSKFQKLLLFSYILYVSFYVSIFVHISKLQVLLYKRKNCLYIFSFCCFLILFLTRIKITVSDRWGHFLSYERLYTRPDFFRIFHYRPERIFTQRKVMIKTQYINETITP